MLINDIEANIDIFIMCSVKFIVSVNNPVNRAYHAKRINKKHSMVKLT